MPKVIAERRPDGTLVSKPLEDMYPFLDRDEFAQNLIVPRTYPLRGELMNQLERRMVQQLQDLRENHHVIGVKAEFEAEGTRLEEALRLKEVISEAGLGLTIKIGGCEAVRDMYESRVIGVDRIVGPMVESPWALHKFVEACKMAYPEEELGPVKFAVNIETVTGVESFAAMLELPDVADLDGIVLGRVDMSGSMGLTREDINSEAVYAIAERVFSRPRPAAWSAPWVAACPPIPAVHAPAAGRQLWTDTRRARSSSRVQRGWATTPTRASSRPWVRADVAQEQARLLRPDLRGGSRADRDAPGPLRPVDRTGRRTIRMKGRTALVTGASRGIGRAVVRAIRGARCSRPGAVA